MISIVTINFNNASGLMKTLRSIEMQDTHILFEHIIIDGGSSDASIDYIKDYASRKINVIWISASDQGIYDAMNKGLGMSSGDYVSFLNSGDVLADKSCLSKLVSEIKLDPTIDLLYGNLCFVDHRDAIVRSWISGHFSRNSLYFGWMFPHPMTTIRRSILLDYGGFNKNYEISGDYDLMLRISISRKLNIKYINDVLVHMEAGGVSNKNWVNVIRGNLEVLKSWYSIKGFLMPLWVVFTKPLSKLKQFERSSKK